MPCTMGNENFPSERSSANPLLDEYYWEFSIARSITKLRAYLRALKVHVIVSNLEVHTEKIDERYIIAVKILSWSPRHRKPSISYTSVFSVAHAIMSFTATRNKPPVSANND